MSELNEILEIVDENNNIIGSATRGECYQKGLLHRAVNIFIYNSQDEVFLHQRSDKKLKYPLFWDISCSEHVKPGETFEEAAKRGLKEELGIDIHFEEVIPIHRMDNSDGQYHDNELIVTFKGVYDGVMKLDINEVAGGKFFNPNELDKLISTGKLKVTSWFLQDWKLLNQNR
jgi:isopentenyl-diphosphate delta-isomerase